MTAQKHLFPPGPALGNLTGKQQAVLDHLAAGSARAIDIGRHLHELDGCQFCNPERTCKFAHPNATRILDSLGTSGRKLVIRRATGLWELTAAARPRDSGELPEGF